MSERVSVGAGEVPAKDSAVLVVRAFERALTGALCVFALVAVLAAVPLAFSEERGFSPLAALVGVNVAFGFACYVAARSLSRTAATLTR